MGGKFPGGAAWYKPRQRRLPGSKRPGRVITVPGMMSGPAATREDEREEAGPPPAGARGAKPGRGEDTRAAGGTWGTQPHNLGPVGSLGCQSRQPLSGYSSGAGACPSPSSVPGERSSHGCGGGHATLPTINGSLCNKQEESCFANAPELSLHNTAWRSIPPPRLNKAGSVSGADGEQIAGWPATRPLAPAAPRPAPGGPGGGQFHNMERGEQGRGCFWGSPRAGAKPWESRGSW